jgi:hypothetical protein
MADKKLKPANLSEELTEEFFKVYRVMTTDFMELTQQVQNLRKMREMADYDSESLGKVVNLCRETEDEALHRFADLLDQNKQDTDAYIEKSQKSLEHYEQRLERASKFITELKEDIEMVDDDGNVNIGNKILFLMDYLHSLGYIMEPEEREELQRKQAQVQ